MKTIVTYQSKYGATKAYAEWIGEELGCEVKEVKEVKVDDLLKYDTIIHGGGLYAEVIAGVGILTKHLEQLKDKKLVVFTTGLTPVECTEYYDTLVVEKNFKGDSRDKIKRFHFSGKMILDELSLVHRTAIKALKKLMSGKENPTEMEKMLIELCDADGDFTNRDEISELIEYVKALA